MAQCRGWPQEQLEETRDFYISLLVVRKVHIPIYLYIFVYISHWLLPEKQLLGKNVLDPRFDMGLISFPPLQQTTCHESGVGRLPSCKHGGFSGYMLLWGAVCFIIKPVKILGGSSLFFPWTKAGNLKWASFCWFIIVIKKYKPILSQSRWGNVHLPRFILRFLRSAILAWGHDYLQEYYMHMRVPDS